MMQNIKINLKKKSPQNLGMTLQKSPQSLQIFLNEPIIMMREEMSAD